MGHWSSTQCLLHGDPEFGGLRPEVFVPAFGRLQSHGGFRWHQGPSQTTALHFVEKGRGFFESDAERTEVAGGELFVFFPGQRVEYGDHDDAPWRYVWMHFEGTRAEALLRECGLSREQPKKHHRVGVGLRRLFGEIEREFGREEPSGAAAAGFAWRLIRELEEGGRRRSPGLARRARFLMDHHFGSPLGVMEVAEELRVSRSTLFREFRREFGCSPKVFLDRRRMELAEQLLLETSRSVKEITFDCGFSSEAYFSRAFRKVHGTPPLKWRTEHHE